MIQNLHDSSALGIDLTGVITDTEMTCRNAGVRMSLMELHQKHPRSSVNFLYREGGEGLLNLQKRGLFKGTSQAAVSYEKETAVDIFCAHWI